MSERRAFILSCDAKCRQCRGTALDSIVTEDSRGRQLVVKVLCVCVEPLAMHGAEKDTSHTVDALGLADRLADIWKKVK